MEQALERKSLIENYRAFQQILHQKGVSFDVLPEAELEKLPMHDLSQIVRQVRELARTPST